MCSQEGVKLLNTWLEGEKAIDFCKFIGHNTAKLRPEEIPSCMFNRQFDLHMFSCQSSITVLKK